MIAIINYGLGNVKAFATVYKNLNIPAKIISHADDLEGIDKVILPGVGAFDFAMERLEKSGMRNSLDDIVLNKKIPVLGICVGMQMLALSSEEGSLPGLGWINGEVKRFRNESMFIPHMGWNNINPKKGNELFSGLDEQSHFYFLHSYYFKCHTEENVIAVTDYYGEFDSAVRAETVYGVQFHPEKSHEWGIKLLENFAKL
jgi:imidazole glycerol-phosphate synthase subunit HisH